MWQSGMVAALFAGVSLGVQQPAREATVHDAAGKDAGRVTMREVSGRITVKVHLQGLPAGIHGLHLHETPKCDPPGFASAGGHYNPTHREHGRQNPRGPHLGDLGNITVSGNGQGDREVTITAALAGQGIPAFLGAGLALIVHANADDEKTDPSGNAGSRIACAVILP